MTIANMMKMIHTKPPLPEEAKGVLEIRGAMTELAADPAQSKSVPNRLLCVMQDIVTVLSVDVKKVRDHVGAVGSQAAHLSVPLQNG